MNQSVEEYVLFLEGKGFSFGTDDMGFIYFGKKYVNVSDVLVNSAIEITLKVQKKFDGSFYVSFLENLKNHHVSTKREAEQFAEQQGLL